MKKRMKSYSQEFKFENVRLSHESDRKVAEVARELIISKSSLFHWRQEPAEDSGQAFPGHGQMKDRDAELAQLCKELGKAQLENKILKKATAIFVQRAKISVHP